MGVPPKTEAEVVFVQGGLGYRIDLFGSFSLKRPWAGLPCQVGQVFATLCAYENHNSPINKFSESGAC